MADKTEMVLVSRDELQQLIGASVRCAFEEYQQVQAPQDTSEYYTIRQLAEKWGVSIATIWRHEKLGHIKGQRIGRRVLFPKEQIDRIKSLKATNRDADKNEEFETACFAVLQIGNGNDRGSMVLPAWEYGRSMQPDLFSFPSVKDDGFGSAEYQTGIKLCHPSRTGRQLHAGTGQGMGYRAQGVCPSVGGFLGTWAYPG